jgi:hypothetical protein
VPGPLRLTSQLRRFAIGNRRSSTALSGMDHVATSVEVHGPVTSVRILSATQLALGFEDGFSAAVPVPAAFVEGAVQAATLDADGTLRLRFASGHEIAESISGYAKAPAEPAPSPVLAAAAA